MSDLGSKIPIAVFFYSRQCTLGNWYAMWRMERSQYYKHSCFIAICINATKSDLDYLSHSQTNDAIDTIECAAGRSKSLCKAIISAVMPDGCVPQSTKPVK